MPGGLNQADIQQALQNTNTPQLFDGIIGSGSTATVLAVANGTFATNQWVNYGIQFTANTVTQGLQNVWSGPITANTSNTITLNAALPYTPAANDTFVIRSFGQQTTNLSSMGGEALPGSPVGTPGSSDPTAVMAIAGSDGTNARTLLTDTTGRLIAAKDLVALAPLSNQAANTDFGAFTAPWAGTATVMITPATDSVVNLRATISGTEYTVGAINSGVALIAGEPFEFDMALSSGIAYAFQFATAQSGNTFLSVKGVAE